MYNLFQGEYIFLHSGEATNFKIDCDALTDEDIRIVAKLIGNRVQFSSVVGIPSGGDRLAKALEKYICDDGPLLIVDDVLTTGGSFRSAREHILRQNSDIAEIIGVCIFCRCERNKPDWVQAVFTMWDY